MHQRPNKPVSITSPSFLNHTNGRLARLNSYNDCFIYNSLPPPDSTAWLSKALALLVIQLFSLLQHTFSTLAAHSSHFSMPRCVHSRGFPGFQSVLSPEYPVLSPSCVLTLLIICLVRVVAVWLSHISYGHLWCF